MHCVCIIKEMGRSDNSQGNAEELKKGNSKNAKHPEAESCHNRKILKDHSSLALKAHPLAGKHVTGIFNDKEKDCPCCRKHRVEERPYNWKNIEEEEEQHAEKKQADFF